MERTLLLVDDDEEIGAALKRLLRLDGYNILCARSGQEGLDLLARNQVQVIVSDQRMPEMSGVEFLSRAKELFPKTVRIILSGYADIDSVTDAINHGAIYKFLTKPWDNETLCTNVLEAFRHYELTEQRNHLALEIQESNTTLASLSLELSKLLEQKDNQIAHIKQYDQLTNLPNRRLFLDTLNRVLDGSKLSPYSVAILLIDLNHFHSINDNCGCEAGDKLLRNVSETLAGFAGDKNTLARMGGNEFGLLLTGLKNAAEAVDIAKNILAALTKQPEAIMARIGVSMYPSDGIDSNTLLKTAGAALRNAKTRGEAITSAS